MKLDRVPFPENMNMVELEGKKVMVRPSQAKSTKGKDVVIGEERQSRMIKPKSLKDGQWKKNERTKPQQRPKVTFDILMAKYKEGKAGIKERKNQTIQIPWIRLVPLPQGAHSTRNPGHNRGEI
jgi:hypothetical protein